MRTQQAALLTCFLVGSIALLIAFYLLVAEIRFVHKATPFDASIVELRHELVRKGKGSVMAYVPLVEIAAGTDGQTRVPVDTFSEEPVYRLGDKMEVLCDLASQKCIRNTFVDKWGDSLLDLIFGLIFLSIPVLYKQLAR